MGRRLVLFASVLLLIMVQPVQLAGQDAEAIFLVRHTERADDGPDANRMALDPMMRDDPPLSNAGFERAQLIAALLKDAGITHVHATDYRRTRQTGQPTADALGLPIRIYDPTDLSAVAEDILATPGRHLVVGHSNTTPDLVAALGGNPGSPIQSLEYDRLYLVVPTEDGVRTFLMRFGDPFGGGMSTPSIQRIP